MAITVGTNTYVTVVEADAYFTTRIDNDAWANAATVDREKALVTATSMIDQYSFVGTIVSDSQVLAWPRTNAIYYDPLIGCNTALDGTIPSRIKRATYEQALHLLLNENLLDDTDQSFEKIKIGPLEIEDKSEFKTTKVSGFVSKFLRPYLSNVGHGGMWWRAN